MHSTCTSVLLRAATPLLAAVACALPAAGLPQGGPTLSADRSVYNTSEIVSFTITGQPADVPILIVGRTPGPITVPPFGEFAVGLVPFPLLYPLAPIPPSGVLVADCPTRCSQRLIRSPLYTQVITFSYNPLVFTGISNGVTIEFTAGDCGTCVSEADGDQYSQFGGGHSFWLPGIGTDFEFVSGGVLHEFANGNAQLTGVIRSESQPTKGFVVDVMFSNRTVRSGAYPPVGSPKKELDASAYIENGGPVDAGSWRYYENTLGYLTGLGDFEGGKLKVTRMGPSFQVGMGASGKNIRFGASGWLTVENISQPTTNASFPSPPQGGDINVDLGGDCTDCATEAGDHSFALPAIGRDFLFVSGGDFVERSNGTANLSGIIAHKDYPNRQFQVDVEFAERVNQGSAGCPPAGSPKKELPASAYVENGGMVDTSTWHYYRVTDGYLTGLGDYAGGLLKLTRMGPAMQVGQGADGKTTDYGASTWLYVDLLQQTTTGFPLPAGQTTGDINIALEGSCP